MSSLLCFLRMLLSYLASLTNNGVVQALVGIMPKSLYSIRKCLNRSTWDVTEYVVCPKCHMLYDPLQCTIHTSSGLEESQLCSFIEFPRHPQASRRSKCNTPLMKKVRIGRKHRLVARKSFFYHILISGIKRLVSRKNFIQACQHWRQRNIPSDIFADIYEGQVWQNLLVIDGESFLANDEDINLCLMLNIDWFNPFDELPYSVGAMYLTVQNLPWSERL